MKRKIESQRVQRNRAEILEHIGQILDILNWGRGTIPSSKTTNESREIYYNEYMKKTQSTGRTRPPHFIIEDGLDFDEFAKGNDYFGALTCLDVAKFDNDIATIKFANDGSQTQKNNISFCWINYKNPNKNPLFFLCNLENIPLLLLQDCLPTHCIEISFFTNPTQVKESAYWDNGIHGLTLNSYNLIDNVTLRQFNKWIINKKKANDSLIVLDVGGGDGRLAKKLMSELTKAQIKVTYFLIEPNENACNIACQNLEGMNVSIFNGTLQDFIQQNIAYKHRADVIISSGGPLNDEIVCKEVAFNNLLSYKEMLADQGIVLATGLTFLHMNKEEIEKQELIVEKTATRVEKAPASIQQYYIFHKHVTEPASEVKNEVGEKFTFLC